MENIKVFACNSAEEFTKEICDNLGIEVGKKDSFKFANDNSFVQLKENVIIGKLIPAGTGMQAYRNVKINTEEQEEQTGESVE